MYTALRKLSSGKSSTTDAIAGGAPGRLQKIAALLLLLAFGPREFYDRVRAKLEIVQRRRRRPQVHYEPVNWATFIEQCRQTALPHLTDADDGFAAFYSHVIERRRSMDSLPFPFIYDGDLRLARLAYFMTRALRPELVVETGVAAGVVSACVLAALERNGRGRLVSIDLPPLGSAWESVGQAIPEGLRTRWTAIRGSGARTLRPALDHLPPVGLFVQDSLFTYRNSLDEYSQVLPHLADRSAIIANAVQHSDAFGSLVRTTRPAVHAVLHAQSKDELIGVCVYRHGPARSFPSCS